MAGRRLLIAWFVVLIGALAPIAARGQNPPPRVALTWTAPAECPSSGAIVAEVDRILGEHGARPAIPLAVDARVTTRDGAYVVEVQTASADGPRSRSLRGKTCAAVADATALVVALAIDPNAVPPPPRESAVALPTPGPTEATSPGGAASPTAAASGPRPEGTPSTPPPSSAARPPEPTPPRAPTPKPAARARVAAVASPSIAPSYRLQAWGGGEVGALPSATPIFGGEAGVVLVGFRIVLGGEALISQTRAVKTTVDTVDGTVGLGAGYLDVGYTFTAGAFELGPLAGFEIGSVHAASTHATTDGSSARLWDAVRAGGFAAWFPTRHVGGFFHLETAFPFSRPKFTLTGPPNITVHQPGEASGRLGVGVELRP